MRWYRKREYGVTPEQYVAMVVYQGGVCASCGESDSRALGLDHDHKTGRIRGLLCRGCNVAISHLKEDPEKAERLAAYIRRHNG